MKTNLFRLTRLLGVLAVLSAIQVGGSQTSEDTHPLIVAKTVHPIYPSDLDHRRITEGHASVVFSVDSEGQLEDIMPLAYSHKGFHDATVAAMKQWEFEPARQEGRPHPVVQFVNIKFKSSGNVISMTPGDAIYAFGQQGSMQSDDYRVVKLSELDAIPIPVNIVRPGYPETYIGSGIEGKVTLEFYIDEAGRVRMPAIIENNGLDFGAAAIEAVSQWTFEPPTLNRRPVAVLVRQKFVFAPSEAEKEAGR